MKPLNEMEIPDTEIGKMIWELLKWVPGKSITKRCGHLGSLLNASYKTVQSWLEGKSGKNPAKITDVRCLYGEYMDHTRSFFFLKLREKKEIKPNVRDN